MPATTPEQITAFIARWESSGAAERANYQMFLSELCGIIGVPRPDPTAPDPTKNLYVFDRAITRTHPDGSTTTNYIDLYKGRHFVCETKQGLSDCSDGLRPSSAGEVSCSGALRASMPLAESEGAASFASDGRRPPLQSVGSDGRRPPLQTKAGHGKRGTLAFDKALERAYHQGRGYITALPAEEGRPPFLIVCDVGHSIDLYAEFTGTGGQYERFPDPVSHRITLPDLHRPEIRERLRQVWLDPHSLDPSKVAAKVTRDIAGRLALLAKSLEADHHDPQVIAGFLQRSLFTMFAEDIGLLPEHGFKTLLEKAKDSPRGFPVLVSALWKEMATGTQYSALLFKEIAHFNGGLFENTTALPLSAAQLAMLTDAAATDWSGVEPSIFGTLLTRALDSRERHKLGAEYTPRSYVERLIRPTIIGPLRDEWDAVRVAAATLHEEADQIELLADQQQTQGAAHLAAGASATAKETGAEATRLRREAARKDAEALAQVIAFHRRLCKLRVLDPACGTANFLYVTMEHIKRLEAEVLELITGLGGNAGMEMHGFRVRPEQFIGLEINQQAVAIAQLVLWIGYFQWQRKTTGKADTGDRPLLPKDQSIFAQDAVLAYDARTPRRDPETGEILTVWNGHSTKPHPITGKEVPDESATIALFDYSNPRRAEWPQADYIVGNPPFIGASRMREALGDGYTEALRKAWKGSVPESADFVMFWWQKAAELVRDGQAKRFGFITTNSIHQTFNRRVIEPFLEGRDRSPSGPANETRQGRDRSPSGPANETRQGRDRSPSGPANETRMSQPKHSPKGSSLDHSSTPHSHGPLGDRSLPMHLAYAIPDHPWIDSADAAAVRIAMTVGAPGYAEGILEKVVAEQARDDGENEVTLSRSGGVLAANLQIGADITSCIALKSNLDISNPGVKLHGAGFIVTAQEAELLLSASNPNSQTIIWEYRNGKDLTERPREVLVIDAYPFSLEELMSQHPGVYQHILVHVKPERDQNSRQTRKKLWWAFGEPNKKLRKQLHGLTRYISTVETSKHRFFQFLDKTILPDNKLVNIACDDAFLLGLLSSSIHVGWALAVGSKLGPTPVYVKTTCFETFPFPALEEGPLKQRIRELGERLDAHRKRQQAQHPGLTLTGMYNVLEKLRAGEALSAKDRETHDQGLISLLKQLHDDLDAAVLEAYGWQDLLAKGPPCSGGLRPSIANEEAPSLSANGIDAHRAPLQSTSPAAAALEQQLLTRLVALNHERAAEEQRGLIRWLRPDFQAPTTSDGHRPPLQAEIPLSTEEENSSTETPKHRNTETPAPWPETLAEQVVAVRQLLLSAGLDPEAGSAETSASSVEPLAERLAACFGRKNAKRSDQITGILATLKALGLLG